MKRTLKRRLVGILCGLNKASLLYKKYFRTLLQVKGPKYCPDHRAAAYVFPFSKLVSTGIAWVYIKIDEAL